MGSNVQRFGFCSLSNDEEVLDRNLLRSPDLAGSVVSIQRGAESAAIGLNRAIGEISSRVEFLVCVHNDVYLPRGWAARVEELLDDLPDSWEVAGLIGQREDGWIRGRLWSTGLGKELGACGFTPGLGSARDSSSAVVTLDEVLLILRTSANLRFDEAVPGFHMYGTDIVLSVLEGSGTCHAIHAPVVHNSTPTFWLNSSYRRAQRYVSRKHQSAVHRRNVVVPLDRWGLTSWRYNLTGKLRSILGRDRGSTKGSIDRRQLDPVVKARELGYE